MTKTRSSFAAVFVAICAVLGLLSFGVPAAHALTGVPEPTSWGKANLISYADSDFESGVGNWAPVSNATISQDSTASLHGNDSLRMAASAAGDASIKMGSSANQSQVSVTGGDTYRLSGWFKTAQSGRTITFADGFYDSSGTWIGWTSGSPVTLNPGQWQYVSETITAPSNAASTISSPKITETGMNAGEALNVDEVIEQPYRAALTIGGKDPSTDGSQWNYMNNTIGPSQVDKEFYSGQLPANYANSNCANLPTNVTCVEAYKTASANTASFVQSIPAGRQVIIVYHQEPEGDYSSGSQFVSEFESEANVVHSNTTDANRANVFMADDSSGYNYGNGRVGADCSYTVPNKYADLYFMDHYMNPVDGSNSASYGTAEQQSEFKNWIGCVGPQNRPLGFGEYGTNCKSGMNPDDSTVAQTFAADNSLLESESFPSSTNGTAGPSYHLPFVDWMYWWYNNTDNCQFQPGASPDGTGVTNQWQANETQNGGGAN